MPNDLYSGIYNPDVLSCLANLSNDEVFTPPEVANSMLDMLPQELFSDPNTKFLDPACKSGVFLREIAKRLLVGLEPVIPDLQERIDHILCQADGTETKENLGANAILGVSLAVARAAANALHLPLYQYLGGCHTSRMPVPMMNILNGGRHADNTVDLQEFMIMPCGAPSFREGLSMCAEIYHTLKQLLKEQGYSTSVGDEGGFAPDLKDSDEALQLIVTAVQKAGYTPGNDVMIAIDAAASELYEESRNVYYFPGESRQSGKTVFRDTAEMVAYYEELIEKYPIVSIEDGLCEDDFEGWKQMTEALGDRVQLVGDDLFVTNTERLKKGIELGAANAILVKINQIGTLSEAFDAVEMAHRAGWQAIISHRSGETVDTMIADIAVAFNTGLIKSGAPCRSERVEKYNRLMRIEEMLGKTADFPCYMDTPVLK